MTENDVRVVWEDYKGMQTKPLLKQILANPFTFKNNTIYLQLKSAVEENNIDTYRPELMRYLRTELSNSSIQLEYQVVAPDKSTRKLYTEHDKFKYLLENYPLVAKLKDTFVLDLM